MQVSFDSKRRKTWDTFLGKQAAKKALRLTGSASTGEAVPGFAHWNNGAQKSPQFLEGHTACVDVVLCYARAHRKRC